VNLGKRVRLRAIERGDIPTFLKWLNDLEVQRYLGRTPFPLSFAESLQDPGGEERWFERHLNGEKSRIFAIETEKGVHIGNIGLHEIDYKDGKATLGIMIGEKGYWDQGYGTAAMTALIDYVFGKTSLNRLYLKTLVNNRRAQKCFAKCGFVPYGHLEKDGYSFILMELHRDDWKKKQG